jgi:hypothetical protein
VNPATGAVVTTVAEELVKPRYRQGWA